LHFTSRAYPGHVSDPTVFGYSGETVEDSVLHDLGRLPADIREGGVARIALYCARELDTGGHAPRDAAAFARELRLSLAQLREMAPGEVKGDITDEVRERRERRLAEG
jgi:hypothetical protein